MTIIKKKMILGSMIFILLTGCGIYAYAQCLHPSYDPVPWDDPIVIDNNNCYSYAFNTMKDTFPSSPGVGAGYDLCIKQDSQDCCWNNVGEVTSRVLADMKKVDTLNISLGSASADCPAGGMKVFMAVRPYEYDPSKGGDIHFYRQDGPGGTWSHKRGHAEVLNTYDYTDSRTIYDPAAAAATLGYTAQPQYFCYCAGTIEQGATDAPIQ